MSDPYALVLARQARELFAGQLMRALPDWAQVCSQHLEMLIDQPKPPAEMQVIRDTWAIFNQRHAAWITSSRQSMLAMLEQPNKPALSPPATTRTTRRLELLDDRAIDSQIMASRLSVRVLDACSSEFNDLRVRIQFLEKREAFAEDDILLPDVFARMLVRQWLELQLPSEGWQLIQEALGAAMADQLLKAYQAANTFLISHDVMRDIDLRGLVRRTSGVAANGNHLAEQRPDSVRGTKKTDELDTNPTSGWFEESTRPGLMSAHSERQLITDSSPMLRARLRAQGMLGHLKRLLTEQLGDEFNAKQASLSVSPLLRQSMDRSVLPVMEEPDTRLAIDNKTETIDQHRVEQATVVLRQRSVELKTAASTPTEKATVEVVALMFQSIVAEERIPASVRLWFARLQIPVLRVALSEPEFFSMLEHPARRLIDRMGSCVMGFESNVNSVELEAEIRRVVQVIEQYPETGRRVFQLVYDEFQSFLTTWLSEQGPARRIVSVAQQVEQKETMSVQYTIELRKLLDDMPVRSEIRDFLFKVWVEVLALASVKYGHQHQETVSLKRVASDLLWAASSKPDRGERARVIQQLPSLLQQLRYGMELLGYSSDLQETYLQSVNNTLTDAFMSRTEVIPQKSLDLLACRLEQLEEYLPAIDTGDLELDNESIEIITGVDASSIEVICQGGTQPSEAMRTWARELQIGDWFGLEHNGKHHNVQLAWRSHHGQLYLFVSGHARCHLIQAHRVAAYLQAGLLVPIEEEALTVRATRAALIKLGANPERLLT